jgi:hypothetical protein
MILCAEYITKRLPTNGEGPESIIFLGVYMVERAGSAGEWTGSIDLDAPHIDGSSPRQGESFWHIILSSVYMPEDSTYMVMALIYMDRRTWSRGRRQVYIEI